MCGVSIWEDKKVLERAQCDSYTTMSMSLMLSKQKISKMVTFMLCILCHNLKKNFF